MKKFEFNMFILMLLGFLIMALSLVGMTSCGTKYSGKEIQKQRLKASKLETITTKTAETDRFLYQRTYQSDDVDFILIKDKETQDEYLCVKVYNGCAIVHLER